MEYTYEGDDICFEEMPSGCVISTYGDDNESLQVIVVSSTRDALALIDSLQRMLEAQKSKGLE